MATKSNYRLVAAGLCAVVAAAFAPGSAVAAPTGSNTGAIYTTDIGCRGVNVNQFPTKDDVYLDGGPHNNHANGLPDGTYYVQVTNPSGSAVLGQSVTDDVTVVNGRFVTCYQLSDIVNTASSNFRTKGYDSTPNNGGVYKVWLSSDAGFVHRFSKTDNFKVNSDCTGTECLPPAGDLGIFKTAAPSLTRTYTWSITKTACADGIDGCTQTVHQSGDSVKFDYTVTATPSAGVDGNWLVTGAITLSNPNNADVTGVDVTDAVNDGGACTIEAPSSGLTVPANGSLTKNYSCTYASAPDPAAGTNTATATWPEQVIGTAPNQLLLQAGSSSFDADFDFAQASPSLSDNCASVSDPLAGGSLGTACVGDSPSQTYNYSYTVPATAGTCVSQPNTASLLTLTTKTLKTASQTVTVCTGADLTVSKTATPTFTRTFKWGITKSVDKNHVDQAAGTTATFSYGVTVTHDAGTDSAWQAAGTITVTNPNDWEDITTDLSDAIDNGGSCSVTNGTNVLVAKGSFATRDYTCTYASAPSPAAGTNTATATWDKAAAFTPDGSAAGTAGVNFATPTTVKDGSVSVADTFAGPLGTLTSSDPSPKTYTYTRTISVLQGCFDYPNTATITNDPDGLLGSAQQLVTVCGRVFGKTMGFWGNKNGVAQVNANGGYGGSNAVPLGVSGGCYVLVDTQAKAQQILPNSLNGIGLTGCTSSTLDTGINANNYNTLLSQTLALGYNIKFISGPNGSFSGQTLGLLGCGPVAPLTSTSTVNDVLARANYLIGNAKKGYGATITQSQIGDMAGLLGCVNREA